MQKPVRARLERRNRPLLEHALLNAQALFHERVIIVPGAHAEAIQTAIDLNVVTPIVNPDWREGMASSIRTGVQALPASATAALILLCDQPLINSVHLRNLIQSRQSAPFKIAASQYHQSIGVPALFPAKFFQPLLTLEGNRGAKPLLIKFEETVLKVRLPEAELDIDSAKDFERLILTQAG